VVAARPNIHTDERFNVSGLNETKNRLAVNSGILANPDWNMDSNQHCDVE